MIAKLRKLIQHIKFNSVFQPKVLTRQFQWHCSVCTNYKNKLCLMCKTTLNLIPDHNFIGLMCNSNRIEIEMAYALSLLMRQNLKLLVFKTIKL